MKPQGRRRFAGAARRARESSLAKALLLVALAWAIPRDAAAQVTYTYLGEPFSTAAPPYSTANRVSGSFVATALPKLQALADIRSLILDFSFTDGVFTRTPANTTICTFEVATDGVGNIVQWLVLLREAPTPAPGNPQQTIQSSFSNDLVGVGPAAATPCGLVALDPAASNSAPGTWTRLFAVVEVPALSPAAAIAMIVLILIAARRAFANTT